MYIQLRLQKAGSPLLLPFSILSTPWKTVSLCVSLSHMSVSFCLALSFSLFLSSVCLCSNTSTWQVPLLEQKREKEEEVSCQSEGERQSSIAAA